jgi:hypothetical protein
MRKAVIQEVHAPLSDVVDVLRTIAFPCWCHKFVVLDLTLDHHLHVDALHQLDEFTFLVVRQQDARLHVSQSSFVVSHDYPRRTNVAISLAISFVSICGGFIRISSAIFLPASATARLAIAV